MFEQHEPLSVSRVSLSLSRSSSSSLSLSSLSLSLVRVLSLSRSSSLSLSLSLSVCLSLSLSHTHTHTHKHIFSWGTELHDYYHHHHDEPKWVTGSRIKPCRLTIRPNRLAACSGTEGFIFRKMATATNALRRFCSSTTAMQYKSVAQKGVLVFHPPPPPLFSLIVIFILCNASNHCE